LIKKLDGLLKTENFVVTFRHVRGHSNSYGNEQADRLANEALNDVQVSC